MHFQNFGIVAILATFSENVSKLPINIGNKIVAYMIFGKRLLKKKTSKTVGYRSYLLYLDVKYLELPVSVLLFNIFNVLIFSILFEVAVNFVTTFANALSFAQVIDPIEPFSRVSHRARQHGRHFWIVLVHEHFRAVVADTAQNSQCFVKETSVEHGTSEFNVAKVTGTVVHIPRTRLTSGKAVDNALKIKIQGG